MGKKICEEAEKMVFYIQISVERCKTEGEGFLLKSQIHPETLYHHVFVSVPQNERAKELL